MKKKVYCIDCIYSCNFGGKCDEFTNKKIVRDNWYQTYTTQILKPKDRNKNNDCSFYKEGIRI